MTYFKPGRTRKAAEGGWIVLSG